MIVGNLLPAGGLQVMRHYALAEVLTRQPALLQFGNSLVEDAWHSGYLQLPASYPPAPRVCLGGVTGEQRLQSAAATGHCRHARAKDCGKGLRQRTAAKARPVARHTPG